MADSGKIRQQLTAALLKNGQSKLGELWDCSAGEVSKRVDGQRNINIDDMAKALTSAGVQIITDPDMRVVHKDEIQALSLFGKLYLDHKVNNVDG
jgi:hypothetical protein